MACCLAMLGVCSLHARESANWRIGETANQEVVASVALDVIDSEATAERKAEAASKTPAIFLENSSITNTMVLKFTAAFAETRADFLDGIQELFHQTKLDEKAIQSTEFEKFVSIFNLGSKKFVITTNLARQWAQGGSGLTTQSNLVELLLQTASRPIRPDDVPDDLELGDTVRLVPVHSSGDAVTLRKAGEEGEVVSLTNVTTISRLRGLFRRDYPPEEQLFARVLANFLHPDCELDTNLTLQARDHAASEIVVKTHYNPGQIIVQRGQVIDAKIQAALARLNETLPPEPVPEPAAVQPSAKPVVQSPGMPELLAIWQAYKIWLLSGLGAVLVVFFLTSWWISALRHRAALAAAQLKVATVRLPVGLAPQLADALKYAVAQELALQRRELLQAQQVAATEVLRSDSAAQ